jgi:hypothetical protein
MLTPRGDDPSRPQRGPRLYALDAVARRYSLLYETVTADPEGLELVLRPEAKDAAEETVIRTLEHPTLSFLRDDAGLVAYLTP